jgi:hypothetical protein
MIVFRFFLDIKRLLKTRPVIAKTICKNMFFLKKNQAVQITAHEDPPGDRLRWRSAHAQAPGPKLLN